MKLQLIVKKAPVTSAAEWLKQAWLLFKTNPALFISIYAFIAFVSMLVLIPFVGIVVFFIVPFLQAGFYSIIVSAQQQKPVQFDMLFKPFQIFELRTPMIRMAAAQLVCALPLMYFSNDMSESLKTGQLDLGSVLLVVMIQMLSAMLFAYAVPIIYFLRENRLFPVIQASVNACWRNVLPLTVFGVLTVSIVFGLVMVASLFGAIVPALTPVILLGILLVTMPVFSIAFFFSFSEFFALVISKETPTEMFEV